MGAPEHTADELVDAIIDVAAKPGIDAYIAREKLLESLFHHPDREAGFARLFEGPDIELRLGAAWHGMRYHKQAIPGAAAAMRPLAQGTDQRGRGARAWFFALAELPDAGPNPEIYPEPYLPLPKGHDRAAAERLIDEAFPPTRAAMLKSLLCEAIRLWPKPVAKAASASRFGGLPVVPAGWSWPEDNEGRPLLFLGQINCAEVSAVARLPWLPERGLLSFFGDRDEVQGCGPFGAAPIVDYFADTALLKSTAMPVADFGPLIACGLDYFPTVELPDPDSAAIARLGLSEAERAAYHDLHDILALCGMPEIHRDEISKLGGWPDLVQRDLGEIENGHDMTLLIQFGWYHDGKDWQGWEPGGRVYFTLGRDDLAAHRFARSAIEMQCT